MRVRTSYEPLVEGIFPLELTWVLTPFLPKTLSDESINRGLVCAHMHSIARTQKILTFMSWTGVCRQQKHTQHAPSTKTEYDNLHGWIEKKPQPTKQTNAKKPCHICKLFTKNGEPQSWERRRKESSRLVRRIAALVTQPL